MRAGSAISTSPSRLSRGSPSPHEQRLSVLQQSPPNASELLALWERAATATQAERDDILLAEQCEAPPSSLGMRNAALVTLRARLLGNILPLRATCVSCGAVAEFAVNCEALSQSLLPVCNA